MENTSVLNTTFQNGYKAEMTNFTREKIYTGKISLSSTSIYLIAEGAENFLNYLNYLGLGSESNLLVLPSGHHYFYERNDLKTVRTLINIKELNFIRDIDGFLDNLHYILPPDANFLGCFSGGDATYGPGLFSRFMTRFNNFLDLRVYHNLSRNDASHLLKTNGFKIVDLSEINGLTYFYSQNICLPARIRA